MKPEFSPTITLGSILSAASMFGAAAAVYAAVVSKDVQHDERIASNSIEISRVERQSVEATKELRDEVKNVNRNLSNINDKLTLYILQDTERKLNARPTTR